MGHFVANGGVLTDWMDYPRPLALPPLVISTGCFSGFLLGLFRELWDHYLFPNCVLLFFVVIFEAAIFGVRFSGGNFLGAIFWGLFLWAIFEGGDFWEAVSLRQFFSDNFQCGYFQGEFRGFHTPSAPNHPLDFRPHETFFRIDLKDFVYAELPDFIAVTWLRFPVIPVVNLMRS